MSLSLDSLGLGDNDAASFSLDSLGLGADSLADHRFNASIVRPDDDADRTPSAVLAYIDRVLSIVDPIRATITPSGTPTTRLAPRPTRTPTPTRRGPTHGRPHDVLHFIDTVLYAFGGNTPTRQQHVLGGYADALIDRELSALRRALELRADAPDSPGHELLPDSLEYVIADRDDRRDDRGRRLLRTHRVLANADNPNGHLARLGVPTGTTTKRGWTHTVRTHVDRLLELGLTVDTILARVNDAD